MAVPHRWLVLVLELDDQIRHFFGGEALVNRRGSPANGDRFAVANNAYSDIIAFVFCWHLVWLTTLSHTNLQN